MLAFANYRIASRQDGQALVYANCVEMPMREVYALVPFKNHDSDSHIINRAAERLTGIDTQARLGTPAPTTH